jgi:uncharacterized RDD family membrane protein YckC
MTSGEPRLASLWDRFGAAVIDTIIQAIIQVIAFYVSALLWAGLASLGTRDASAGPAVMGIICGLVAVWLYSALLESSARQATLGKRACGIVVADLEGNRISFGRASVRFWAKALLSNGLTFGLGYLLALVTSRRQALHDLIAGTVVLERRS